MPDYGQPASYLTLAPGTPVFCSDEQQVGTVTHVLYVAEKDIFDGIVISTGDGHRFVDAPEVGAIYENGVTLSISSDEAAQLPKPGANPAAMSVDPSDTVSHGLSDKLRRAWHMITGDS